MPSLPALWRRMALKVKHQAEGNAVARIFVLGSASMRMFTDAPTAAHWLAGRIGWSLGSSCERSPRCPAEGLDDLSPCQAQEPST